MTCLTHNTVYQVISEMSFQAIALIQLNSNQEKIHPKIQKHKNKLTLG